MPHEVVPRSREELAIELAIYTAGHETEDVPIEFFRCDEEIEIAQSLTSTERLGAGALVFESLAELAGDEGRPEVDPAIEEHAWEVALHLYGERDLARRRELAMPRNAPPRAYARPLARARSPRARANVRRRALARAGPDDGSGSDEPPPARDLDGLRGFAVASSRMFHHVGRRRAATRIA
jgi:hypothetical protein